MESSAAALADFSGLSGETTVTDAYGGAARFDLGRWLSLNPEKKKPDRQNLIGASYIRRNVDFLINLIENHPAPPSIDAPKKCEIVWYRPGGSGWGCSPELQKAGFPTKFPLVQKFGRLPIRTNPTNPGCSRH